MTRLLYLEDSCLFEATAQLVEQIENNKGLALIAEQTIFYPQGGGQPCDLGEMSNDHSMFKVTDVRLDEMGRVLHYGEYRQGGFRAGDCVHQTIDRDRRIVNSRLHSAGHLLDCAVAELGLDQLTPAKGYHFPQGPYVEYNGLLENPADYVMQVQHLIDELVKKDLALQAWELTPEQAKIQGVWAPPGKSARVVAFAGYEGCGCGGTHMQSSSDIGRIVIRKISSKKGVTRIAYTVGAD